MTSQSTDAVQKSPQKETVGHALTAVTEWTDYAVERPTTAGVYEWRVPSVVVKDAIVIVASHMRERGAGYQQVLSPNFDYWDGYRVHVPAGLQWRNTAEHADLKDYRDKLICVEGLDIGECLYCRKKPRLNALQRHSDGGVVVCGSPQRYNSWWMECCEWGGTPRRSDPREIERTRRAAILTAKLSTDLPVCENSALSDSSLHPSSSSKGGA